MTRRRYPAVFMRGGTGKAIVFHARGLPAARAWMAGPRAIIANRS